MRRTCSTGAPGPRPTVEQLNAQRKKQQQQAGQAAPYSRPQEIIVPSQANPVLEAELFGLPRETARLDLTITWNGNTGSAAFYRDGMNNYTTVIMMPAAQDSPPQTSLALDLPGASPAL